MAMKGFPLEQIFHSGDHPRKRLLQGQDRETHGMVKLFLLRTGVGWCRSEGQQGLEHRHVDV